jgi:hypothetical protein
MATYTYVTSEEMFAIMEEDKKAANAVISKTILLTTEQQAIYDKAIVDGELIAGVVGEPFTKDINNVVDYLAENHTIELVTMQNDIYETNEFGEEILIEEKPQTIKYEIKED